MARSGSAQSPQALPIRQQTVEQKICIFNVQTGSICWHIHINRSADVHFRTSFFFFFFFLQAHTLPRIQLQPHKANINVWKEASGHPVEISHLIALHLQVASVGFRQEQSLLLKHCVVRIHKAGDAHTQPSLGPPQPLKLGPHSHLLSHAAGLKLMLTAWRLIYDKHLFLSSWELSHAI